MIVPESELRDGLGLDPIRPREVRQATCAQDVELRTQFRLSPIIKVFVNEYLPSVWKNDLTMVVSRDRGDLDGETRAKDLQLSVLWNNMQEAKGYF